MSEEKNDSHLQNAEKKNKSPKKIEESKNPENTESSQKSPKKLKDSKNTKNSSKKTDNLEEKLNEQYKIYQELMEEIYPGTKLTKDVYCKMLALVQNDNYHFKSPEEQKENHRQRINEIMLKNK